MSCSEEVDSRVHFLIDWLVSALLALHEHKISPGLVQMIVDRLEQHGGAQDALGLKMVMTSLGIKADWAWEEGRLDEAVILFERLMSLVKPDDPRYYHEVAGKVRVLFDKGNHLAAFDLIGRSALTAMGVDELAGREAFEMLALSKFGDLHESVKSQVLLDAIARYESRFLANEEIHLARLWKDDPHKALDTLLAYSPSPQAE